MPESTPVKIIIATCLIIGASLCSGLNLGMLALDKVRLQAIMSSGTEQEKKYVKRVLPILEDRHLLIASILLGNALCCELLPELLDELIGKILTIIFCVSVIVIFCEIIPQALSIKYGVKICAIFSPFVWALIFCFFIIGFPLARALDAILGHDHVDYYSREELMELIQMHGQAKWKPNLNEPKIDFQVADNDLFQNSVQQKVNSQQRITSQHRVTSVEKLQKILSQKQLDNQAQTILNYDEVSIIQGIFLLHTKQVKDIVKPLDDVYMLDYNTVLTRQIYEQIYELGFSRIPVFFKERSNIMGVLMTKQLIKGDPDKEIKLTALEINPKIPLIPENHFLSDALREFEKGTAHIAAVVSEQNFRTIGIVTLEDVLEQLLQEQIYDESDARRFKSKKAQSALANMKAQGTKSKIPFRKPE